MVKKVFQGSAAVLAFMIALTYGFGYDYLFRGIRETYLRGKTENCFMNNIGIDIMSDRKPIPFLWQKRLR